MKLFRRKKARGEFAQEQIEDVPMPSEPESADSPAEEAFQVEEILDMLGGTDTEPDKSRDSAEQQSAAFAKRQRLAGNVASLPRRRKIWDIEADPNSTGFSPAGTASRTPADEDRPDQADASLTLSETDPVPEDVALARAQIAQFSQAGLHAEPPPSGGRTKTRLLGFQSATPDPFAEKAGENARAAQSFPVGWIVVIDGPGRGACFTLTSGVASIGRSADQSIGLDFGDSSISRQNHASIAYDDEANCFLLGHGGKSNIVRLNGRPVLSTEDLANGDTIRIGETTLRFTAFCGEAFTWVDEGSETEGPYAVAE